MTYHVELKEVNRKVIMMDDIRCRNGNLNVIVAKGRRCRMNYKKPHGCPPFWPEHLYWQAVKVIRIGGHHICR